MKLTFTINIPNSPLSTLFAARALLRASLLLAAVRCYGSCKVV
jgi:hypothetical protein